MAVGSVGIQSNALLQQENIICGIVSLFKLNIQQTHIFAFQSFGSCLQSRPYPRTLS
jgi:hypothetical protein